MPARRPTRPAPPDVDALRTALGQGKVVRVGIAPSGQFPDGVTGRVRRIGDPAIDGDEYLFVEVPVGGSKDVLPFAAIDLTGPPARRAASTAAPAAVGTRPGTSSKPRGGSRTAVRAAGAPLELVPAQASSPVAAPVLTSVPRDGSGSSTPTTTGATAPSLASAPSLVPVPSAGPPPKATGRAAGPGRSPGQSPGRTTPTGRGRRPPVSITISTAGDDSASWRIEAKIGAKSAVRPTVIPPSRVWSIVESLGEPALTAVVHTLLEDHRRSTQARADALAAELASLQQELESFPDNDSR
ncbi:hypothetical protein ABIB25_000862 [Nakamurella sp. UYEF19]|uniref:hypothetical protein n=1 Tax=Nakamurella sp. UYEF19 TaxID=1756392 RepID=UPI003396E235